MSEDALQHPDLHDSDLDTIANEPHERHRILFRLDEVKRLRAERRVGRYGGPDC